MKRFVERIRGIDKRIFILAAVCLLIEVFICNANSFRVLNQETYERKSYTVDQMETTGFEVTGNILTYVADYGEEASVTIKNIDTNVGTIYLDLYLPNESYLSYTVYYTDEANQYLSRSFSGEYVPGVERTKWRTCHFSGKSDEIKIVFNIEDDLYQMAVDECSFNKPVEFHFSAVRFLILLSIVLGIYLMRSHPYWYGALRYRGQACILCVCTILFLGILGSIYVNSVDEVRVASEEGDLYSQHLTDALLDGQVKLKLQPSEKLLSMDNPYDATEREAKGLIRDEDYILDAAYYDGNYYVYFGIVPAFLLFVPFTLCTGMYLSTGFVTFVFFCIYLIFLNALLIKFIRKILPETSFGTYILGIWMLDAASVALCFVSRARFYEMVYAVGLAFSAIGLYFLASAFWKEQKNCIQIFFGALFLALAVGCRPTMVFYSFLLAPYLVYRLKNDTVKENIKIFAVLLIPYICVAGILMWYNYARFGNIFDFGQNYQLTVTDMARDSYKLSTLPWCLWFGMFQPLSFSAVFPFVSSGSMVNDYAGYFWNNSAVTMFSSTPLLYIMFCPVFWKAWKRKTGMLSTAIMGTGIGMGLLLSVFIFISAGVHIRYTAEPVPILVFGVLLLFANYMNGQDKLVQKNLITLLFVLTIFTVLVGFLIGIVGEQNWIFTRHPEFYFSVERAFCFWK